MLLGIAYPVFLLVWFNRARAKQTLAQWRTR
jgi:hypothetical protein